MQYLTHCACDAWAHFRWLVLVGTSRAMASLDAAGIHVFSQLPHSRCPMVRVGFT